MTRKPPSVGVHIGQQNLPFPELRELWRRLDAARVDWISVWDHFYEAPPQGGTVPHFEALTTLGALAADTMHARIGCLVFYVGYRNPAMLAKAATTLDHLSGGRFEIGLGAGWHEWEAHAYGYDFPPVSTRLDMLEEAAVVISGLLREERTTFKGKHFRVENASCLPRPVQGRLPIWIGGLGERRTLHLAARFADGWNAAYVSAPEFARLGGVLDRWCETESRDPATIRRAINLTFNLVEDAKALKRERAHIRDTWGSMADRVIEGALLCTPDQAADRLLAYAAVGATDLNIALRAPWREEALDAFVTDVMPRIRSGR